MKKLLVLLSTILTLTLVIFASTLAVSAEDPATGGLCGIEGSDVAWSFDAATGTLTITGNGAIKDYYNNMSYHDSPWYQYNDRITKISIGQGITSIGAQAFINCVNLKSIEIPDNVLTIGDYAFAGCTGLRTVDIGNGVQSIGMRAFQNCWGIYQLTLGNGLGTGNSPQAIGAYAFADCNLLVEIYDLAPGYLVQQSSSDPVAHSALVIHTDAAAESRIIEVNDYVFYYHDNGNNVSAYLLDYIGEDTDLVLPDYVNNNEYRIRANAFRNRKGLTSVSIPATVASIGANAFAGCSAVDTDVYGVQYVGKWLVRCPVAATECVIREDTIGLADEAFKNCNLIESIVIPDSVVNFGMSAFESCTALKSVTIGDGIKRVGSYAFRYCSSLESITVGEGVTAWGSLATEGCSTLNAVHISNLVKWCNIDFENGYNPLYQAGNLYLNGELITDLVIPAEITELKKAAFGGATCIKTVVVHDKVTKIGGAPFGGCTNLESLTVPFLSEAIDSTNEYVIGLGYIVGTVPNSLRHVKITAATEIPSKAFYNCSYIVSVELPETLVDINAQAFYGCTSLISIKLPARLSYIGSQAFNRCDKLIDIYNGSSWDLSYNFTNSNLDDYAKNIYTEKGGSKLVTSGDYIFYCDDEKSEYYLVGYIGNASEITLPANINGNNYEVYKYALCYCDSITKITIPETVTVIGDYAFHYTKNLTDISVPSTIEKFGAYVFNKANVNATTQYDNAWYLGNENDPYVVLVKADNTSITSCEIHPKTKIIFSQAFSGCLELADITFPDGLTAICDSVFYRCRALTKIVIPDSVKYIGGNAFLDCASVTELIVGDGIESMGISSQKAFGQCYAIKTVTAPAIVIPHLDTTVVESITVTSGTELSDSTFAHMEHLTTLILPDTLTKFGNEIFYQCNSLVYTTYEGGSYIGSVENPYMILVIGAKDNYEVETFTIHKDTKFIYDSAFEGAYSLKEIVIPDSVVKIGNNAFADCSALANVKLSKNLECIGDKAFNYCTHIEKLVLPNSIKYIGYNGIYTYYTSVIYCGEDWNDVVDNCNITVQAHDLKFINDGEQHHSKCEYCGYESEKVEHEMDGGVITTYPQHEVPGVTTYSCKCGYTETEEIPAIEHSWSDYISKEATHTEEGEWTYYCQGCPVTRTEPIPKTEDHEWDWGTTTKESTHLEEGVMTYTCPCGETKTEAIPKSTNHEYTSEITKEPTHTENGIMTHTCLCGDTYDSTIDRLYDEHEYNEGVVTQEPTHTECGVMTFTCTCGESYTENLEKLTDHTFGDWFVHSDGQHSRACECGEYEYEDHVFDDEYDDTCDACGLRRTVEKPTESQTQTETEEKIEQNTETKEPAHFDDEDKDNDDDDGNSSSGGCGSSISGGAFVMMALLMGAAIVLNKKKD